MSFMLPAYRDANVRWYTELLPDGRTAVRTRYDSPETCLRPVIHTPNDIYDDPAEAVAHAAIMDDNRAFVQYTMLGQAFYDLLLAGLRANKVHTYPVLKSAHPELTAKLNAPNPLPRSHGLR